MRNGGAGTTDRTSCRTRFRHRRLFPVGAACAAIAMIALVTLVLTAVPLALVTMATR